MFKKIALMLLLSLSLMAKTYQRIVVLDPAAVEIMYMMGAEDKIVAIAHSQTTPIIPAEKTKKSSKCWKFNEAKYRTDNG